MDSNERAFCTALLYEANTALLVGTAKNESELVQQASRIISRVTGWLLLGAIPFHELAALHELQKSTSVSYADGLDAIDRIAKNPRAFSGAAA